MAATQAQLNALESALFRGVRRVTYDGETIEYNSTDEMIRLRALMRRELGLADSGRRYAAFDKGV